MTQQYQKIPLVIDTDIGTDCDDAFALAYATKNSNANVKAIVTVQEHYKVRAKIARKLTQLVGKNIPIIIGSDGQEKYWTGIESNILSAAECMISIEKLAFPTYDADTKIACLGPLTNIALQLKENPHIKNVKTIYVMGSHDASHNFQVDLQAKEQVFSQPWNIYQITKEDSLKIYLTKEDIKSLEKNKLGKFLAASANQWLELIKREQASMYDVLVVSAALGEGYVKFKQIAPNRFISCGVDLKLKDKLLEAIANAS